MIYSWQHEQYERLIQSYRAGAMPHALLVCGLAGVGKYDFAFHVAKTVLCENENSGGCNQCQSCRWVQSQSHPDFIEIGLEEKSKVIKIHQIPITFKNRTKGESKIPKIEILRTIKNLLILKFIE